MSDMFDSLQEEMAGLRRELEAVKGERDALAAHLLQVKHTFNRYDLADYCSDEEVDAESDLYDLMEKYPTTSLARRDLLKQAEAIENLGPELVDILDRIKAKQVAAELRRQAGEGA